MTATTEAIESAELRRAIGDGTLTEIEVAWSDPFGHSAGKRIPAAQFLDRALGTGFAFCEAALGWNTDGTVIDTLRLTNWDGGYPDVFAVPDLSTFTRLPWRGPPAVTGRTWGLEGQSVPLRVASRLVRSRSKEAPLY